MNQKNPTVQQQINIELPKEQSGGTYANLAIINHSPAEFVIDFSRILPGVPSAKVYSRIIMTPQHTKSLLMALEDNIKKYESQHGEIKSLLGNNTGKNFGFQASPVEEK